MSEPKRHAWAPQWARLTDDAPIHIEGWYEDRRVDEDGQAEETPCGARCTICGETFYKLCLSGLFRAHIANFAGVHLHRDPLAPKVKRS